MIKQIYVVNEKEQPTYSRSLKNLSKNEKQIAHTLVSHGEVIEMTERKKPHTFQKERETFQKERQMGIQVKQTRFMQVYRKFD